MEISADLTTLGDHDIHFEHDVYRLDVHDSGMPINPGYLDEIFEEYTIYSYNGDRSYGGLGLLPDDFKATSRLGMGRES